MLLDYCRLMLRHLRLMRRHDFYVYAAMPLSP